VLGVEIKPPTQVEGVIYIKKNSILKMDYSFLFAIDPKTEEVIVSNSPKGTKKINFIERVHREENEVFYYSVVTLTSLTKFSDFDVNLFKSMDKVCQMIYKKFKESRI
jgi:outer membrane lipoprotein-sorting protein